MEEKPTEAVPPPHHPLPHIGHHGRRHHPREDDLLSENQSPQADRRAPQSHRRHNRIVVHHRGGQAGSQDMVEAAPQQQVVEVPAPGQRLWRKGNAMCNRQLSWRLQLPSGSTSSSWCCHCRQLLFDDPNSVASWHCRGELPTSCRWQGQVSAENISESCQWRLPTAAWQPQAAGELETSDAWQWEGRIASWAWKTI